MRIAVFGASGFVGATLVERLWLDAGVEVVPVIHSSGNAARLARFGKPLMVADVLQAATLDRALDGCTHVVNCSRGPAEVMARGLRNLLDASQRANVKRFVHLSSVAAYGDPDGPTLDESAAPRPQPSTYGWTKHAQDQLVERAADRGLSSVVLCPPNISGSYSAFLMEVVQTIRRGELALVDGGRYPIELVDVENLVHAIRLALTAATADGRRIFVTDGSQATWAQVASALLPLADRTAPLPSIAEADARTLCVDPAPPSITLRGTVKHLCSSDMRSTLRKDPLFAAAEKSMKSAIKQLPRLEQALRRRFEERTPVKRVSRSPRYSERLIRQQLRDIRYSQSRARTVLQYEPVIGTEQSLAAFRAWYAGLYGWNDGTWSLTRHLYQ